VMRRMAGLIVVAMLGAGASQARAAGSSEAQAWLESDGTGRLFAGAGGHAWSWQSCRADGSGCAPFATGQSIETGSAPAGTVFRAIAENGLTLTSPVWLGDVRVTRPPGASGAIRANRLVTPVAAGFSGGWAGDLSATQLAACTGADGTGCISLTARHYVDPCPGQGAVIPPGFAGRYLRVADQLSGPGTIEPLYAVGSPYGMSVWPAGAITAVSVVGRIGAAPGPPTDPCAISAVIRRDGTAVVRCPTQTCNAVLVANAGRLTVRGTFRGFSGRVAALRLPARALARLRAARVTLNVYVDGIWFARRGVQV